MEARRLSVLVALLLLSWSAPSWANTITEDPETPTTKKQAYLAAKSAAPDLAAAERDRWHRTLKRRIGKKPEPLVNIYNTWTHETMSFSRDAKRISFDEETVDRFLRCHFTNEPADMDQKVFRVLVEAAVHFDADRIHIISGFRAPKYNLVLRKKGRQVARNSQHPKGKAIDFRLPGVGIKRLHSWARSLKLGGVGFYPGSRFIHVDSGKVRYWTGR